MRVARGEPGADPEHHCALNVALYGARHRRWTMTERGRTRIERRPQHFQIGPSMLRYAGDCLEITIDERAVPWPFAVRGRIRLYPRWLSGETFALDDQGRHHWGPIAASARIEVELDRPQLRWRGEAYFDANDGCEPVDRAFDEWDWSRAMMRDGSVSVIYDVRQRAGVERLLALGFSPDGSVEPFTAPARAAIGSTAWRIERHLRSDSAASVRIRDTLEDTPFYARSIVQTQLRGEPVVAMHETLKVARLISRPVQWMLPWRMPRRA
jgi:carotenoid 1,2-hydratase